MKPEFPERFNMADYFLYDNLEKGRADKVCLYYRDDQWTYGAVARWANRAGNALRELGVRVEDRVLFVLPDCPEFVAGWFGASKAGAVITMVNPLLTVSDYVYYLDYTRARVAIIAESLVETFAAAVKDAKYLRNVLVVADKSPVPSPQSPVLDSKNHDLPSRFMFFHQVVEEMADELTPADTSRDDIAIWLFTSGSTGHPKGAVHLHHDLPFNTEVFAKQTIGVREDDVSVGVPKLFFGYATGTNLLFPFAVGGATALFSNRSTAQKIYQVIAKYRPTILTTVPTMINAMLNAPEAAGADLSCLRFCYSAGEALPPELYHRWMERFGVEIYDGIGSAEMFHIYVSNRPGDVKPGSLGRVVEGYEAKIADAGGNKVATGEMGQLHIKGDSAAICYWRNHEASKEKFAGDWCFTGDLFHQDAAGYFWYHGRADDMLKVGGVWVAPIEIENCLLQHAAVLECAVIGHDAGDGLVKPKAFIVLRAGHAASDELTANIQNFVKTTLAPYKYPRRIEYRADLPKNDRGKVDKKLLKQL